MPKLVSLRDLNLMSNNFEKELLTEPKNQSLINKNRPPGGRFFAFTLKAEM